jgi:DNA-binding transcriptional LysR family regulator
MRSLNLDQLRSLETVIGLASFTAAARRLNLSQSTVSVQIRELERRFGVQLIERMGRRAYATPPGRDLIEATQRILRECQSAEDLMRRYREGWIGHVHLGTTNTALMYDLPPILRELRSNYPGVDLRVTNMPTRDSVEQVIRNNIDLALVTLPVEKRQLRITPLCRQALIAIFPRGTANLPDEVTPAFVAEQSLLIEHARGAVHALVMRWLGDKLPLPRPPMHLGTIEALKTAVAANLGMSIVPDVAVRKRNRDLIVRPLRPQVPCTLALIEHENKPRASALEIVRDALLGLRATGQVSAPRGRSKR